MYSFENSSLTYEVVNHPYRPSFFRIYEDEDRERLEELLLMVPGVMRFDRIKDQLKELLTIRHADWGREIADHSGLIQKHLNGIDQSEYGVWVYYPWNKRLVHTLDESEFIEVRTYRNQGTITREEQAQFVAKTMGIIGLSTGQSVAITMALERIVGEIRLADWDSIGLSDFNYAQTGIYNLGLKKAYLAAREIAKIDPFIRVKCFSEGFTENSLEEFLLSNGTLDLLVDEGDDAEINARVRQKAQELGMAVLSKFGDNGLMGLARGELNLERYILNKLIDAGHLQNSIPLPLTKKKSYSMRMNQLKKKDVSINEPCFEPDGFKPQLASSLALEGAILTEAARYILVSQLA